MLQHISNALPSMSSAASNCLRMSSLTVKWGCRQISTFYSGPVTTAIVHIWNINRAGPFLVFAVATGIAFEGAHLMRAEGRVEARSINWERDLNSSLALTVMGTVLLVLSGATMYAGYTHAGWHWSIGAAGAMVPLTTGICLAQPN